jgi:2-C-methyl-D-erythritol 4-phosphate cytidylyltransferase
MNRVAVIVAGGSGTRMGNDLPKQFLKLKGREILLYSVDAFINAYADIKIILVLPKDYISLTNALIGEQNYTTRIDVVEGGATRFDSVKNGLHHVGDAEIVFVHDAVRCLVTTKLIKECSTSAEAKGSAVPVIPVRDSMRRVDTHSNTSTIINRENLVVVQTPQTFKKNILVSAFNVSYSPQFTDEATVVEAAGHEIHLIPGEETNIKITFPEDLDYAEWRIGNRD